MWCRGIFNGWHIDPIIGQCSQQSKLQMHASLRNSHLVTLFASAFYTGGFICAIENTIAAILALIPISLLGSISIWLISLEAQYWYWALRLILPWEPSLMSMIMFHPIMMTVDDRDDENWSMGSDDDIGYWAAADHGNGDWKRCWKTVDRLISCRIKGIKYLIWRPRCRQPPPKPESRGSHKIVTGGAHCRSRSSKITSGARSSQMIIKVAQTPEK